MKLSIFVGGLLLLPAKMLSVLLLKLKDFLNSKVKLFMLVITSQGKILKERKFLLLDVEILEWNSHLILAIIMLYLPWLFVAR